MSPSQEVAQATGLEGETLEQRAARLRQVVATPSERDLAARELLEVETQIADRDRAARTAEAKDRLLHIRQALGGLAETTKGDNTELIGAAQAFVAAAKKVNERFHKIALLKHEAASLCDMFDLPVPELPSVMVPAARPEVHEAFSLVHSARVAEHGRIATAVDSVRYPDGRSGPGARTYEELKGTPGADLIRRKLGK
ncbi:MAG TPA: hypothetical protein VN908_06495 [Gemmatimonadales bacterium]|nr:hypothetical protein [Gemmatimonadales bacterium]